MPIDINTLRDYKGGDPEKAREHQRARFRPPEWVDDVLKVDEEWRGCVESVNQARKKLNKLQREVIAPKKKNKESCDAELAQADAIKKEIESIEKKMPGLEEQRDKLLYKLGNIVDPEVPISQDEDEDNVVCRLHPLPSGVKLPCPLGKLEYERPPSKPMTHDDLLWRIDGCARAMMGGAPRHELTPLSPSSTPLSPSRRPRARARARQLRARSRSERRGLALLLPQERGRAAQPGHHQLWHRAPARARVRDGLVPSSPFPLLSRRRAGRPRRLIARASRRLCRYEPVQTPFFMKKEIMSGIAQLEDYDEQLYKVVGKTDDPEGATEKYLIATSEQPMCGYHQGDWLEESELPKKCASGAARAAREGAERTCAYFDERTLAVPVRYAGVSSCFRKEAGSSGKDIRGIFRVHQFEKVEQFVVTKDDLAESTKMQTDMLKCAEDFYQARARVAGIRSRRTRA